MLLIRSTKSDNLVNMIYREMEKEKNISYTNIQPGDVNITFADIENTKKNTWLFPFNRYYYRDQEFYKMEAAAK